MIDIETDTRTAGAYILYDGYFVFMFGYGHNHPNNVLGIVRLGGHREKGESVIQCVTREVKEESSLDIAFYNNRYIYVEKDNSNEYEKIEGNQINSPVLVLNGKENKLSVMYLAYGHGTLVPKTETQGILFLRKEDIKTICSKNTTFKEYKENGGKFILVTELPESAVLSPHVQMRFLNKLFELDEDLMVRYTKS